ncbi:MAG: ribonuclease III [Hyphomicrobiaceae bacterium]
MPRAKSIKPLEDALGYHFKNEALRDRALTHASVQASKKTHGGGDNERLEFLGDRVLGLAIAQDLSETFPSATEGELARHYNRLVRGRTCALVGREIGIGDHLILSESEDLSGGRDKDTIIADSVEAILAVIFLESGFVTAREVILRIWKKHSESLPEATPDAKSALQEWAQGNGLPLPSYVELRRDGPDHAPKFKSEVRIDGAEPAAGEGSSKRSAEQAAARTFLLRDGVWKARS